MTDQIENLISEIRQISEQYTHEVGKGRRRAWPRSIIERVMTLDQMGAKTKQVAEKTGVPYETILQWRYKQRLQFKRNFHQLQIAGDSPKEVVKIGTVTVPKNDVENPIAQTAPAQTGTVTVTTPEGYRIETTSTEALVAILRALRGAK